MVSKAKEMLSVFSTSRTIRQSLPRRIKHLDGDTKIRINLQRLIHFWCKIITTGNNDNDTQTSSYYQLTSARHPEASPQTACRKLQSDVKSLGTRWKCLQNGVDLQPYPQADLGAHLCTAMEEPFCITTRCSSESVQVISSTVLRPSRVAVIILRRDIHSRYS